MEFGYIAQYKDFIEQWQGKKRKLVLFGAGEQAARVMSTYFPLDEVAFICDNNQSLWGKSLLGRQICSPSLLADTPDDYIVIICVLNSYGFYSVCSQLRQLKINNYYSHGILSLRSKIETYDSNWANRFIPFNAFQLIDQHKDDIAEVRAYMSDEKSLYVYDAMIEKMKYGLGDYTDICDTNSAKGEYFDDGIFEYTDNEIFVDVGPYDGTNSVQFSEMLGNKFKKTLFFEPDENNYSQSVCNISKHLEADKYAGFKMGLSDENGTIGFYHTGGLASRINENTDNGIEIARFDDIDSINDQIITFVKLDVEGQELNVLRGMQKSIKKHKPKLAVCIYHKYEDLWVLPKYIKSLVPEYNLFVRHHSTGLFGKILYAKT